MSPCHYNDVIVTPLAGVWIESCLVISRTPPLYVTPLAGVWIERRCLVVMLDQVFCHSPCGSVD